MEPVPIFSGRRQRGNEKGTVPVSLTMAYMLTPASVPI